MASKPTVLVLGAGPRVGASTAKLFAHNGYNVAIVSRKGTGTRDAEGFLSLKADFTQPDSIPGLFDAVKAEFHTAPSVVIYNAATLTPQPDQNNPLSIPVENISKDLNVNTVTPYVAAQEALKGWETLSKETKKTFIYTGNGLNVNISPLAFVLNLGIGKRASSYWIGLADSKFSAQEYRFHYADERKENGEQKGLEIDGEAHAEFFLKLANREGSVPWQATFVKDKGYVQFE